MDNQSQHKLSDHQQKSSLNQCNDFRQPIAQSSQMQLIRQNTHQELQRSKRRIQLLQKNKDIANQQLGLYRQEISANSAKIMQLERLLNQSSIVSKSQRIQMPKRLNSQDHFSIIISEKDEQIHMLSLQVKQCMRKHQLILQNQLTLEEKLKSKTRMIDYLKQSSNQQIHFYQQYIQQLQEQLQQKQSIIQKTLANNNLHLQKQKKQWINTNSNLSVRLCFIQRQISHQKIRQKRLKQEYQKMKIENNQLSDKVAESEEKVHWYKSLLEQTKLQFINAELLRHDEHQKALRKKIKLKRNTQCSKEQVKMMNECTTCVPSSVKSYRKYSTCSVVTPFQLTPEHSQQVSLLNECSNPSEQQNAISASE